MSDQNVTLIIFSAGSTDDDTERLVTQARHAITADVVARARAVNVIERIIVATDSRELVTTLQPYEVIADYDEQGRSDGQPFSFGARLAQIIERYDVRKPFYMGGGAGGLLTLDEMRSMAERLQAADDIMIPNNYWSSDFVAFTPGHAAIGLAPLETDNNLAFLLRTQRGLTYTPQPRTVGTQFDVDTPTDVSLLSYAPNVGAHTRKFLQGANLDTAHIERLLPQLTQREPELLVYGRVSAEVWLNFERNIACRTRLISEERGLIASGREARGEARSLLGFVFDAHGVARAFQLLNELCTGALIDTRVLLAHRKLKTSARDRFNADLMRPELISDPWLREFTQGALDAPIPVLLGGHSLVCGGLYLLIDACEKYWPQ